MKTIFGLFIFVFLLTGCRIIDIDYDTYIIFNKTDNFVCILAFDNYYIEGDSILVNEVPNLLDSITITPKGKYIVEKRTGEDWQPRGYFKGESDSVVIIFDNYKRIIYKCKYDFCADAGNIIEYRNNSKVTCKKKNGCLYEYYITSEDYEKAEILE